MTLSASIQAIGLAGPGLQGWVQGREVLAGKQTWLPTPLDKYAPPRLPRNERRRATRLTRLAFQAADEAVVGCSEAQLAQLASVFASSEGDMDVVDSVSRALTQPERPISPTQFHNSVHNSPAGYWSIATASQRRSTSLSAFNDTAVAGLIEALLMLVAGEQEVLLVCYDIAPPVPLHAVRPIVEDLAFALRLAPAGRPGLAQLSLKQGAETGMDVPMALRALVAGNPAAQLLPLLAALANEQSAPFGLGVEQSVVVQIE